MAIEIWATADLIEVAYDDQASPPDGFWLRFYPRVITSQAEEIYFDQIPVRDRRLAPFVSPNVQGRVMRSLGFNMASFKPAYVKPKHVVDPARAIPRRRGEPFGGNLSLQERYDAIVADNIVTERALIERRWDWMGGQAMVYGSVTVAGDDYPSRTVDFGRDASLTTTLTSGVYWNETNGDPMADISLQRKNAFTRGRAPVNTLVFGVDAWDAFASRPEFTILLNNQNRGSNSLFNTTGLASGEPYEYQGRIQGPNGGGQIDMWTYSNEYEADDASMVQYLDPRDVVGIGGNVQGFQCFGAIMDSDAGLQSLPMFPKSWKNEDPSVTYTMTQSAPLPVPANINNTFRIRALA